jgi:hypothetical protein
MALAGKSKMAALVLLFYVQLAAAGAEIKVEVENSGVLELTDANFDEERMPPE